ncbi:hexose transporter [Pterulicium gracile]|uniref:Hexose transporter n=1 Tax=Pterulicium gracile TaxID=1884261 RepID=A0A5C3QED5_9AGAR|nr:hexose transporter [Pterula gracilis]
MAPGTVAGTAGLDSKVTELIDPHKKWHNNRRLIVLNSWIFLLLITSSTNGFDGSMMNGLQSLPQWKLAFNDPDGAKLGLLGAIQNIGGFSALPFSPYITDTFGRRVAVFLGCVLMIIGAALQTASQTVEMFIGARFLLGFGLTFAANSAPLLVAELSYPTYRAPLTSMYNSMWYSGSIVAAWSTFGTFKINSSWSWRVPSLLQALPSLIQIGLIFICPESPRWLVSKGRNEEALKTLAYYHADGNDQDPLVQYEFEEIKAAIELDKANKNIGWLSLIKTSGNRKRLRVIAAIAFFSQWSGNGLISYYLTKVLDQLGITNPTTQLLINGLLQIWNLFWALSAAVFVERVGRRFLFITSTAGMLVWYILQTVGLAVFSNTGADAAAHATIAFIFLFYAFYDIAWSPLIVTYTVEILPYQIRAKGMTFFSFVISLTLIFNQYVNPIALKDLEWKYYIVYDVWLLVELIFVYFYIVETKGKTLEETAALFDGDDADKLANIASEAVHGQEREDTDSKEKVDLDGKSSQ